MATVETIDPIARAEIEQHLADHDPHDEAHDHVLLKSPNGTVWRLTIDDNGITTLTPVSS